IAGLGIVYLDGSGSSDPDGDPLTFSWTIVSKPPGSSAQISDPTAVRPNFVADVVGAYVIRLVVNDGILDSDPGTVMITASEDGILSGQLREGRIDRSGQVDQYRFSGYADERVTLTLTASGFPLGATATATVFLPSGGQMITFNANSQRQLTLPESGTYV